MKVACSTAVHCRRGQAGFSDKQFFNVFPTLIPVYTIVNITFVKDFKWEIYPHLVLC